MELKRGRLIDHVHLRTKNLEAAGRFYKAVLGALGIPVEIAADHIWADELWIDVGPQESRVHLAFNAPDEETVQRFYRAGLEAGGRDNGPPGERKVYHPGYYGAFLLDPDGNNIEAVYHGPAKWSAKEITISW